MIAVKTIAIVMFVAYMFYAIKRELDCISDTFYASGKTPMFSEFMFAQALLLLPCMLDVSTENSKCIAFLTAMCVAFVGASPYYKSGMDAKVHKVSCVCAMTLSVLWVAMNGYYWAYMAIVVGVAISVLNLKQWLLWVEIAMFLMIYLSVLR